MKLLYTLTVSHPGDVKSPAGPDRNGGLFCDYPSVLGQRRRMVMGVIPFLIGWPVLIAVLIPFLKSERVRGLLSM